MSDPTDEQRRVIERPAASGTLVHAGPGTGKTFTLIRRAGRLASTGTEVHALAFNRSVVAEVRRRAAQVSSGPLTVSTIHSRALRLLLRHGAEIPEDLDDALIRAARLLRELPSEKERYGHVLIDEAQDVTGPMLEFCLAVLDHSDGWTVLGDQRQRIYSFHGAAVDLVDVLREGPAAHVELSLSRTHRGHVAEQLRRHAHLDPAALLRDARPLSSLQQAALLLRRGGGSKAILVRTNGEALALSDDLWRAGVATALRQDATVRMPPAWIAAFANAAPRERWSRRQARPVLDALDAQEAGLRWSVLRRVAADGDGVARERLRRAVAVPGPHDDFVAEYDGPVLSTIHRAKGLEWDDVIVLQRDEPDDDEERRVDFVAATRARGQLWRLSRPRWEGRLHLDKRERRWEWRSWKRSAVLRLEMKVGDVMADVPFGGRPDADEIQRTLADPRLVGRPASLQRRGETYDVVVDDRPLARASPALAAAITRRWRTPPKILDGARVHAVRTAAGDPDRGVDVGLPETGLWLVPELIGFIGHAEGRAS